MERKTSNRMNRVEEECKREISNIINYKIKNQNITGIISITNIHVSPDLKIATVYVSIVNSKSKKNTLTGLEKASGFIRTELAKILNLRITPKLIFKLDDSMEYGAKIDSILKQIKGDEI